MIETGLDDLLGGFATVYPINRPLKGDLPCIVWKRISTVGSQNHDGPTGLASLRFQFTIHADSEFAALAVAKQVAKLLDGYKAPIADTNVGNTQIANQVDLGFFESTKSHQVAVDAIFHTEE